MEQLIIIIFLTFCIFLRNRFYHTEQHIPCLAHVINLAVQEILGKRGLKAEAPKEAALFDAEDDIQYLINSGLTPNAGAPQEEDDVEPDEALDDQADVNPLHKLRRGIKKIRYHFHTTVCT